MSAVITLYTGQPGNGKTLKVVAELEKLAQAGRLLYVHGIRELKIPHQPLDDPEKWYEVPDGAVVVIDECQKIFPPRSPGQRVPQKVSEFETLRHRGLEAIVITQNASLIDIELRKLVGHHIHVERFGGFEFAQVFEWPRCGTIENKRDRKDAQKDWWWFPARLYSLYKSAELHTIQRKMPKVAKYAIASFLFLALALPLSISYLRSGTVPDLGKNHSSTVQRSESAPTLAYSAVPAPVAQPLDYAESRIPRIDGLPQTAPAYDELTRPKRYPRPAACIAATDRCNCYSQDGTRLPMVPTSVCRNIVADGYFDDAQPDRPAVVASATPAAAVPLTSPVPQTAALPAPAVTATAPSSTRNPALWW